MLPTSSGTSEWASEFCSYSPFLVNQNCCLSPHSFCLHPCRHLDLFSGCSDNDFDAVLAEIEKEMSMADIVAELGYGCTIDSSHCKEILSQFQPLNEMTISKLIGTIVRTHTGLEDPLNIHATFCSALGSSITTDSSLLNSWNVNVLIDTIKQLVSIDLSLSHHHHHLLLLLLLD